MKIRDLYINGFGHFADRPFGPFESPVTIFLGENETGKTTLLEFIRCVLFGFRTARYNQYLPIAGGRHGGIISVNADDGRIIAVSRNRGSTSAGTVSLTGGEGNPISAAELPRLVGNHSREVFEGVFCFTLDELHDEGILGKDAVNAQIYSAGMGATDLPGAFKALADEKDKLLRPRASSTINEISIGLGSVQDKLDEARNNSNDYARSSEILEQIELELSSLQESRRRTEFALRRGSDLDHAWEHWVALTTAHQNHAELPEIENFPLDGINRLDGLNTRKTEYSEAVDTALARVQSLEEAAEAPIDHEEILEESESINRLQRSRSAFDQSVKDIPDRQAELDEMRRNLGRTLADLGPDWDAERLTQFDLSLVVREEIADYGKCIADARENVLRAESGLSNSTTSLKEAQDSIQNIEKFLKDAGEGGLYDQERLRERQDLLTRARRAYDEYLRSCELLETYERQDALNADGSDSGSSPLTLGILGAIVAFIGVGAIVVGATSGGYILGAGLLAGLALLAIAAVLLVGLRASPYRAAFGSAVSDQSQMVGTLTKTQGERVAELQSTLADLTCQLDVETVDEDTLNLEDQRLEYERRRLDEVERLSRELERANTLAEQRTLVRSNAKAASEEKLQSLKLVEADWQEWLATRNLHNSFTPDSVEALRNLLQLGHTQLQDVQVMQDRIKAIEKDICEFVEPLLPLATIHGFKIDENDHQQAAIVADRLIELHSSVGEQIRDRNAAKRELRSAREEFTQRDKRLKSIEEEITKLLAAGGANDENEFRDRANTAQRRSEFTEKASAARDIIQGISGPGEAFQSLLSELETTNKDDIADQVSRSEKELEETDDKIRTLIQERTEVNFEREKLIGDEESSRLRAERERLMEEIHVHARRWTTLTVAENILKEAQRKFEQERQPDVIRNTERFFRQITEERYKTVYSPLGENKILVSATNEDPKEPSQLSRGTREQLYLSLRFGLIQELTQHTESLPVVVDEVLVNFDQQRGLQAAIAFTKLAQSIQVLAFTCHSWVVDLYREAADEIGVSAPDIIEI